MKATLLGALLILTSTPLIACSWDSDCDFGSRCIKNDYSIYGICAGGMNPGNSHDSQPVYNQLQPWKKTGKTCQFDTDCGIGSECFKSGYNIYGVCN